MNVAYFVGYILGWATGERIPNEAEHPVQRIAAD
jgi:hypothetical protein